MSTAHDAPRPGDLIVALNPMRAWSTDHKRGIDGISIAAGEQALVLETWTVGQHRRIRVVRDQRIMLFSCPDHAVARNWRPER